MRLWPEVFAGIQIVGATVLVVASPVFLAIGQEQLQLNDANYAAASSFVGVVLGAMLGMLVQAYFSSEHERTLRLGVGYSVFFKIQKFASDAGQICLHVNSHRPAEGEQRHWRSLPPFLLPSLSHADFTPEELALFAIRGQHKFADDLADLASAHNHLVSLNEDYRSRLELLAKARLQNRVEGVSNDNLAVDEDIVMQLAARLFRLAADVEPLLERVALNVGNTISAILDDDRFRGQLAPRLRVER